MAFTLTRWNLCYKVVCLLEGVNDKLLEHQSLELIFYPGKSVMAATLGFDTHSGYVLDLPYCIPPS